MANNAREWSHANKSFSFVGTVIMVQIEIEEALFDTIETVGRKSYSFKMTSFSEAKQDWNSQIQGEAESEARWTG